MASRGDGLRATRPPVVTRRVCYESASVVRVMTDAGPGPDLRPDDAVLRVNFAPAGARKTHVVTREFIDRVLAAYPQAKEATVLFPSLRDARPLLETTRLERLLLVVDQFSTWPTLIDGKVSIDHLQQLVIHCADDYVPLQLPPPSPKTHLYLSNVAHYAGTVGVAGELTMATTTNDTRLWRGVTIVASPDCYLSRRGALRMLARCPAREVFRVCDPARAIDDVLVNNSAAERKQERADGTMASSLVPLMTTLEELTLESKTATWALFSMLFAQAPQFFDPAATNCTWRRLTLTPPSARDDPLTGSTRLFETALTRFVVHNRRLGAVRVYLDPQDPELIPKITVVVRAAVCAANGPGQRLDVRIAPSYLSFHTFGALTKVCDLLNVWLGSAGRADWTHAVFARARPLDFVGVANAVRAGDQDLALSSMYHDPLPEPRVLTKVGGDRYYASATWQTAEDDVGPDRTRLRIVFVDAPISVVGEREKGTNTSSK